MSVLADRVLELQTRGVQVIWAASLSWSGVWLAEESLLILNASYPEWKQIEACDDLLLLGEEELTGGGTAEVTGDGSGELRSGHSA